MKYAVLIPAYNESRNIRRVIQESSNFIRDIIVVDDGSHDDTCLIAEKAGAIVLRHSQNMGKGSAISTGFSEIMKRDFDAVITIDADGQHRPNEIPVLTSAFESGLGDIIIGVRTINRENMPLHRAAANRFAEFFISMAAGASLRDTQSGFRAYSRKVIEKVRTETSGFEMETEILIKSCRQGFTIGCVPVTTVYHANYTSHFRPVRDFYKISILVLKHLIKK